MMFWEWHEKMFCYPIAGAMKGDGSDKSHVIKEWLDFLEDDCEGTVAFVSMTQVGADGDILVIAKAEFGGEG